LVQTLRERYAGVKLVVGRDKLDEVQVGSSLSPSTVPAFTALYRVYAINYWHSKPF
jgi:hypothetical protein